MPKLKFNKDDSILAGDTQLLWNTNASTDEEGWQILFYYNLYRLGLTILLVALASPVINQLSTADSAYNLVVPIAGIATISLLTFINIKRRWPALYIQAHLLFFLDIIFISMLTLSQHLLESSTLILYVTTTAATAVLFHLRVSLGYTLICAILIFYSDFVKLTAGTAVIDNYYLTPLLLVGLVSIVVIVGTVAKRSRTALTVLEKQEIELADLDQINNVIIDQLDIGVLFLDRGLNIQLINLGAKKLLSGFINSNNQLDGELAKTLTQYLRNSSTKGFNYRIQNQDLGFSTVPLRKGYLIQIENRTDLEKQIQQSKMVSIGRMASAISHEIRNPLSAINHAAQLLQPTDPKNTEDIELIQIIRTHAKRIDEIIESVLQRSRPGQIQGKELSLLPWLKVFADTFQDTISNNDVILSSTGENATILFDPTQFEQIITNLCQNSIKYAKPEGEKLKIRFNVSVIWDGTIYLDITDNGQGVNAENVEQLFEPFYTSDSKSTGLGLFLVREFCTLNGAEIEYIRGTNRHGFRISFPPVETKVGSE